MSVTLADLHLDLVRAANAIKRQRWWFAVPVLEYRWAEGRTEDFSAIANEFVRLKMDIILTVGNAANVAQGHETIPIVAVIATTLLEPVWWLLSAAGLQSTRPSIQSADTRKTN